MVDHHWTLEVHSDSEEIEIKKPQPSASDLGSNLLGEGLFKCITPLGKLITLVCVIISTYRNLCLTLCHFLSSQSILPITSSRPLSQPAKTWICWGGQAALTFSCGWGKNESLQRLGEGRVQTWLGFVWYWLDFSCCFFVLTWSLSRKRAELLDIEGSSNGSIRLVLLVRVCGGCNQNTCSWLK